MRRKRSANANANESGSASTSQKWSLLRLLVSGALLGLVLSRLDLARAAEILASAHILLLVLAVLVFSAGRFAAAFRWWIFLRAMKTSVPYRVVVRLSFIGMFLQMMPAGAVASEAAKVYGINRTTSDLAGSFASVLVDRIFGLGALILLGLVGLAFAPPGVPPLLGDLAWIGFVGVLAGGYIMMNPVARNLLDAFLARIRLEPVRTRLQKVFIRLDQMRSSPALMGWSVVAALANTAFRVIPAWFVAMALSIDASLPHLFIIIPLVYLAAQIPISVGGLGVREVGWVALLRIIDVPASDAILMSLVLAAMSFVVSLPGAWLYTRHGLGVPEGEAPTEAPDGASAGIVANPSSGVSSRASRRA